MMNDLTKCELHEWIEDIEKDVPDKDNVFFDLLKWSEEEPYWCVFVHDGFSNIFGHYCLAKDANFHETLTCLADNSIKCSVLQGYFIDGYWQE